MEGTPIAARVPPLPSSRHQLSISVRPVSIARPAALAGPAVRAAARTHRKRDVGPDADAPDPSPCGKLAAGHRERRATRKIERPSMSRPVGVGENR